MHSVQRMKQLTCQIYGLDETTGSEDSSDQIAAEWLDGQEAAVKENRWIEENGKWKLEKPVAKPVVVQSEESAEAPAAENASDDEVLVASERKSGCRNCNRITG